MSHIKTVQRIYEAFGKGDIPAILGCLADNVEWEYGLNSTSVPWLQPRRGRAQTAQFFEALAGIDFHKFEPTKFLETDNVVVSLIQLDVSVRATGRRVVEEDEVHIWYFDSAGQVSKFRHRVDTHQHWLAFTGK
jgi:ketosteroid isomerase-like protein